MRFIDPSIIKAFSKKKYLDIFPKLKDARVQKITEITLTFIAIPVFGLFAISPTATTIAHLRKKLADNRFVYESLKEKNKNLITLQTKYSQIQKDVPLIVSSLPKDQLPTLFIAQVQGLSQKYNFSLGAVQISSIDFFGPAKYTNTFFTFTTSGEGTYENALLFLNALGNFDRITSIDAISIAKSADKSKPTAQISVSGKAYFKK